MNLFRLLTIVALPAGLAASLSSCLNEPTFSTTPEISFNSIRRARNTPADPLGQPTDTIFVTVNYQDGDGDLGLNDGDLDIAPFKSGSFVDGNGITRYYANNYFITPLLRDPNTHKLAPADLTGSGIPFTDDGTFFHISDVADKPLRGTLTRKLYYNLGDLLPINRPVYFQVQLVDRGLHLSNVIVTDSIVIPPR